MPDLLPAASAAPSLALAEPVKRVPRAAVLPGGCLYEPKWDGYRISVATSETGVMIWSRHGKNLTQYFPDLAEAVSGHVPHAGASSTAKRSSGRKDASTSVQDTPGTNPQGREQAKGRHAREHA